MIRRLYGKMSLLISLLLILQILLSMNALAETTDISSMLPPSNLSVQMLTPDDAKLMWSSVYGASGYNVYGIIDGQLILIGTSKTTYYTINDLPEGSYRYVVSTLNGTDESGPSAPVTVDVVYPTMAAPATLTYAVQNGNDYLLTWKASQYAESYNVYKVQPDGQKTLVTSVTGLSYNLVNLPVGSYKYVVSAVNSKYGESASSSDVQFDVTFPTMTAPVTFTYAISNVNDVTLKWSAVTYATGYKIYQVSGAEKVLKVTVTGTSVSYTNLPGGDYVFEIHSYSDRFGESADSKQVSFSVASVTMVAPGNFTYKIQNGNDIILAWDAVTNATNYKLYQIIDGQKVLKSTVTGTTVTYKNMPAGSYTYEIHSYSDHFGESAEGSQVIFTLDPVTMMPPVNLTANLKNVNDIVLTWDTALNANSYKVYQIIDGVKVLKTTVTGTTVTYVKMPAGDYTYEVYSFSTRFGESVEGSQVTVTVGSQDIAPPSNLSYTIKNGNDIALTWDPLVDANSYKVYQVINGQKVLKSTVTGTTVTYANQPAGDYAYEVHSYSTRFGQSQDSSAIAITLVHPIMAPPTNVVQKILSATQFTLSWDPALYAYSYKVYQIVNGQKVLKSTVTSTSVTYSNMSPGEYTFEVHSYSTRFRESVEGTTLTMTLNGQMMQEPINPSYTITSGNNITLKWTGVPYANSYKIYQVVDGQKVLKSTVTSTSITYSNMPEGDYQFILHSYSKPLGESPDGVQLNFSLVFPTMQAPTNLAAKVQNGNDVVLTWAAVTYANSYKVYEFVDGQEVLKTTVTALSAVISKAPSGDHTYVVHSVSSRFGESKEGAQISVTLQDVTMLPPTSLTYSITHGNDINLKWNTATYANSYNIYQVIDGEKLLKRRVTTTSTIFSNMPAGEYTFVVHSYSTTRFGESPEGTEISFTLEPVTMLPPANLTQSIVNGNDIVLKWNPSTYANSYKVYRIIGGEKVLKSTVTGTTVKYTIMPEGAYTFEVHSFSTRFGESPEASKLDFELVWPEVVSPILKGDVFNANNITLSWQAVTGTKEYRIYEVKGAERELLYKGNVLTYKLYNLTEDTHYYEVTAYSIRFGESAPSNRLIENIIYPIMQPPTAALSLLSTTSARISWDFVVYANGYNIYEIVNGQPVLLVKNLNNLSYTLTDLPYADHEYIVTSVSNSFGESEPSNKVIAKLIVDTEPPVTKANAPTGWTNQNPVTVTLSATDDETGVANTYYAINDGTFTAGTSVMIENDGVTKISFYSVDKVGNIETAKTIEVKIDKTAPVTKTSEVPAWSKEPVTVTLSATDAQSGVAKTLYAIDDSPYNEGTTFTIGEEGIHKVTFYSVDVAGNIESTQTIEVKIDKTAPVVTMDLQEEYKLGTTVPLAFLASDNLSGIADAKMTVYGPDDAAGQVVPNGTAFLLDKAGVYKITVTATDAAGLTTTIQKQFVVFIPATIEVTPKVMKGNDGIFTVRVELPEGYSTQEFDLNTATLNGVKALTSNNGYYNQAKLGQFKFERSDFNWTPSETIVTFRCYVDGNLVVGQTTVKVQK